MLTEISLPISVTKLPVVRAGDGFKILLITTVTLLMNASLGTAPSILITLLPELPVSVHWYASIEGTSSIMTIMHEMGEDWRERESYSGGK